MSKDDLLEEIGKRLVKDDLISLVQNLRGGVAPPGVAPSSASADPAAHAADQRAAGNETAHAGTYALSQDRLPSE